MPSGGGNSIITSSTAINNNQFKYFRPTKIDHDERRPRENFISESEFNDHIREPAENVLAARRIKNQS